MLIMEAKNEKGIRKLEGNTPSRPQGISAALTMMTGFMKQ